MQTIEMRSIEDLRAYLKRVPRERARHIRELSVCTQPSASVDAWCSSDDGDRGTADLSALLMACVKLEKLSLQLWGSPASSFVSSFAHLKRLHTLSISNVAPDEHMPM